MDTICAVSTAAGRAGVAVIRLSGPDAVDIAEQLVTGLPEAGRFALRKLRFPGGEAIDEALVLRFVAPASFTGEDVIEFQPHGSPAVQTAVMEALVAAGARPAEAGEFTRRALMNDKLDVVAAEGLSDLLASETRAQLRQAQDVLSGRLAETVEYLRSRLLRAAALLEAMIDFADEDIPEDVTEDARAVMREVRARLETEIAGSFQAERLREGFEVAIVGPPNAGKSTLLNALAGREAALVSEVAGTTRDIVEVRMDLRGLPVTWLDTAGMRETDERVEQMGIARARERASGADLRMILKGHPEDVASIAPGPDDLVLVSKADIQPGDVSGVSGAGVDAMLNHVFAVLSKRVANVGSATRLRHRVAFEQAAHALDMADVDAVEERLDLAAEQVRVAIRGLETLVGRIDVEAVLGEIFSTFCVGK